MKNKKFLVKFPNETMEIFAGCVKDALILALAERIKSGYALNPISCFDEKTKEYVLFGTEYQIKFEN